MQVENAKPGAPNDWPSLGAMVRKVWPRPTPLPAAITLPEQSANDGNLTWPGQDAGFLGRAADPWLIDGDPSNTWPVIILLLLIGVVVGFVNGFISTVLRVPSFITTLGMLLILNGAVFLWTGGAPRGGLALSLLLGLLSPPKERLPIVPRVCRGR